MKTYTEIEKLADEVYPTTDMGKLKSNIGFIQGYTQCQKDNKDKKYTEEDLMSAFNAGINNDYGNGPSFDKWLNSLNKKEK